MSKLCIVDASPTVIGGLAIALAATLIALIWTSVRFSNKVSYYSVELNRERTREARRLLYAANPLNHEEDFLTWDRRYVALVEETFNPCRAWKLVITSGSLPFANSTEHPEYSCDSATLATIKQTILTGERPVRTPAAI